MNLLNFKPLTCRIILIALSIFISWGRTAGGIAEETEPGLDCLKCHNEIWDQETIKNFVR